MYKEYLYHGSQTEGLKILRPSISLEFKKLVYATPDFSYALVRAGKQLDLIREEYYGMCKSFELAECYPKAFEQMFDTEGYVYLVNKKDFKMNPDTGEWYSEKPVEVQDVIRVENIWQIMNCPYTPDIYRLIRFEDSESYWKTVRGGREGFLERKLANKKRMLELRKEAE